MRVSGSERKELVEYLRGIQHGTPTYPLGFTTNQKRGLGQQAACFEGKDGVPFHSSTNSGAERKRPCRIVVAIAENNRPIQACHDGIDSGHYGRDKTMSKVHTVTIDMFLYDVTMLAVYNTISHYLPSVQLNESYWWKGMASDVSEHCSRCDKCQRVGPDPTTAAFTQRDMRSHLLSCNEARKLSGFPVRSNCRRPKPVRKEVLSIYCVPSN